MNVKLVGLKNIIIDRGSIILHNVELNTSPNPYGNPYRKKVAVGHIEIGCNCKIKDNVKIISYSGSVKIGNNCSINPYVVIYGHGGVIIGNDVMIATKTTIVSANHGFTETEKKMNQQTVIGKGIVVEDDVWIGANVTILDGVRIGKGSIIAAGAVVDKSCDKGSIIGGVPARLIKSRVR